jgi:hypothetical protein
VQAWRLKQAAMRVMGCQVIVVKSKLKKFVCVFVWHIIKLIECWQTDSIPKRQSFVLETINVRQKGRRSALKMKWKFDLWGMFSSFFVFEFKF